MEIEEFGTLAKEAERNIAGYIQGTIDSLQAEAKVKISGCEVQIIDLTSLDGSPESKVGLVKLRMEF
jgi:hypothetical protein